MERALGLLLACFALGAAPAAHAASEVAGRTTAEVRIIGGDRGQGFSFLRAGSGEPYTVREDLGAKAAAGRAKTRRSIAYFAQLTDFQLADEENPARVEALDPLGGPLTAAWRPQEALLPQMIDSAVRQVGEHRSSPVPQGDGSRARLALALLTGDNADNQFALETLWVRQLVDGGRLDPNSGSVDPADHAVCPPGTPGVEEAPKYTGFQDYDDYFESTDFYDPDQPLGLFAGWPSYPGLMDKAQEPFEAAGLGVPSYVAFGNHDALAQGNEDAIAAYESIALSCGKPLAPTSGSGLSLDPNVLMSDPSKLLLVPPDPRRTYVDKPQYKALFAPGVDGHGFALVEKAENEASRGAAGYYGFSPSPGLRFIALDTVCDGGVVGPSAEGNLDDPQFRWLVAQLDRAEAADELTIVFAHHSIQSLTCNVPDEAATPCTGTGPHGHDPNPGCDLDPRDSSPVHLGDEVTALFHAHPHVVAFVAGHSHVNDVAAFPKPGPVPAAGEGGGPLPGGGFWNLRTSAEADWPHQQRLVEIMDNRDGTLSIFGTLIDNASPVGVPAPGTAAAGMTLEQLASIGRVLGYNDPQAGGGTGEGEGPVDRNVELVIADPRRTRTSVAAKIKPRLRVTVQPRTVRVRRRTRFTFRVTSGGRPVRGARVGFAGRGRRTDRRGRVRMTVRLLRARTLKVKATRRGYRAGTAKVRALRRP